MGGVPYMQFGCHVIRNGLGSPVVRMRATGPRSSFKVLVNGKFFCQHGGPAFVNPLQ